MVGCGAETPSPGAKQMAEIARNQSHRLSSLLASARLRLCEEALNVGSIAGFFLIGFLLVLLIINLSLAQYSIEASALPRAVAGALIAAKVVLVFDRTPLARALATYPAAVPVLLRTLFYGLAVVILRLAELVIRDRGSHGGLAGSASFVARHSDFHKLLALALGVALVFCAYFTLAEIGKFVGPGVLSRLFFMPRITGGTLRVPPNAS